MNVLISPSPVSAVTVQQAVISVPALVMNIFAPSIRQPPSGGCRARAGGAGVRPGLRLGEPERRERPARREVRHPPLALLRVPNMTIGIVPSPVWAATVTATAESTRASSSMAMA